MARELLTDFELMLLLATLRLGDLAYGADAHSSHRDQSVHSIVITRSGAS